MNKPHNLVTLFLPSWYSSLHNHITHLCPTTDRGHVHSSGSTELSKGSRVCFFHWSRPSVITRIVLGYDWIIYRSGTNREDVHYYLLVESVLGTEDHRELRAAVGLIGSSSGLLSSFQRSEVKGGGGIVEDPGSRRRCEAVVFREAGRYRVGVGKWK